MPRSKLIGKSILIGVTYFEADGTMLEQKQMFGTVEDFRRGRSISIKLDDGSMLDLPPDRSALQPADPGEYHLRGSGKIVKNPDLLCTYSITKPVKH